MIKASLLAFVAAAAAYATPTRLRCEYLDNPLAIDASTPHLS